MKFTFFICMLILGLSFPMLGIFMLGIAIFLGGVWLLGSLAEMLDD